MQTVLSYRLENDVLSVMEELSSELHVAPPPHTPPPLSLFLKFVRHFAFYIRREMN